MSDEDLADAHDFRSTWPGWATVESDPIIFDCLVRDIGVQGISVEEVYSLDPESLQALGPTHGLIFLFHSTAEQERHNQEPQDSVPADLWFANQVVTNACASLALLNIVLNLDNVHLGEHLTQFKDFTKDFTPPLRGISLTNFEHLRRLHNSFARKMEMQESDLSLMKASRARTPKHQKNSNSSSSEDDDEDDAVFHFIAYIYKAGHVWELDGIERAPLRLGVASQDNWTRVAAPMIQERMQRSAAHDIRFNLLALCQDPSIELEKARRESIAAHTAAVKQQDQSKIQSLAQEIDSISERLDQQAAKRASNKLYVARHRHDYTDFTRKMLEILNAKGVLQQMLE